MLSARSNSVIVYQHIQRTIKIKYKITKNTWTWVMSGEKIFRIKIKERTSKKQWINKWIN